MKRDIGMARETRGCIPYPYLLYLRGVSDTGTRLLFKLRSGTHGLNGRHRGKGRQEGVFDV